MLAWLNLKFKLAHFSLCSIQIAALRAGARPQEAPTAPDSWWNDPAVAAAARDAPGIRRLRALTRAISEECDRHGTRLVLMIIPAHNYTAKGRQSPLTRIFGDWGITAPVIDVAAQANATPKPSRLVFSLDGHLNPSGHQFVAATALEPLGRALGIGTPSPPGPASELADRRNEAPVR